MADNIIKVNVTSVKQQRVSVSSSRVGTEITASGDTGRFWAQTAKNWAVADAIVDNTDYSSKHYAQEAKTSAQNASNYEVSIRETAANAVTEIQGVKESAISDIDITAKNYDNLTHKNITNCITEKPKRIKLELVDGVLTLKKGSIIVFPRGTEDKTSQYAIGKEFNNSKFKIVDRVFKYNKFFVWVELQTDITDSGTDTSSKKTNRIITLNPSGTMLEMGVSRSGNTEYSGTGNCTTYRTDLNLIQYHYSGVLQNYNGSLPIATVISDGISQTYGSIDQIFNDFGCIGNTIFCDKGVKALIPSNWNVDGTLKNIEITTDSVLIDTRNIKSSTFKLVLNASSFSNWTNAFYDAERNYNVNAIGGSSIGRAIVGTCETDANGAIINFKPHLPFRAVDYNDFNTKVDEIEATLDTKVNKSGDTMTGTLTSTANNGSEIHIKGIGDNNWLTIKGSVDNYDYNDYANVPTKTLRNLRLISYDKKGIYYFFQQVSAEPNRNICAFQVKRKLTDGTEKKCELALRVQDTGVNTPLINGQPLRAFVTETYVSGTSWYRVWSDGWIEQGGNGGNGAGTVTLLKKFINTNYNITATATSSGATSAFGVNVKSKATNSFSYYNATGDFMWRACGYIA